MAPASRGAELRADDRRRGGFDKQRFRPSRGLHAILGLDASGRPLRSWGDGILPSPHGSTVDPEANVWATDIGSHTVVQFTPSGRVRRVLGLKDRSGPDEAPFNPPAPVASGPKGEVSMTDGYGNSRVVKYSREGRFLLAWGEKGKEPGEFNAPHTIAVDPEGTVDVGGRENHRVRIFDAQGRFLKQWTHPGSRWELSFAAGRHPFLCDGCRNRVLELDREGRIPGVLGQPGQTPGRLSLAHHPARGRKGELHVAEAANWSVQKFLLQ